MSTSSHERIPMSRSHTDDSDSLLAILPHNTSTPCPRARHVVNACLFLIRSSFGMPRSGVALHSGTAWTACSSQHVKQSAAAYANPTFSQTLIGVITTSWKWYNFLARGLSDIYTYITTAYPVSCLLTCLIASLAFCHSPPRSFLILNALCLKNGAVTTSIQGQVPNKSKSEKLIILYRSWGASVHIGNPHNMATCHCHRDPLATCPNSLHSSWSEPDDVLGFTEQNAISML